MEIERKFLVLTPPAGYESLPSHAIQQGYLLSGTDNGIEVRVWSTGGRHFLTIKHGQGLCRTEVELPLAAGDFQTLWALTEDRHVCKTRYRLLWEGHWVELDVYSGALAGLLIAEVEFASVEGSAAFQVPPFCGREVTDDPDYRNANLARQGLPAL